MFYYFNIDLILFKNCLNSDIEEFSCCFTYLFAKLSTIHAFVFSYCI